MRAIIPYLAYAYITFVGLTTRVRVRGEEHRARLRRENKRFIYAFWHQRQILFTWTHRGDPSDTLVSRSKDGELIAKTMSLCGIGARRGSSSRAGAAAVRELMDSVAAGRDISITPDGPKGPARQVKHGVIYLAQTLGIPILPLTNAVSRKLEFSKSWDQFQVPLPFGRAVVRYGEPIYVGAHDDAAAKAAQLAAALDAITDQAESEVKQRPSEGA